MAERAALFALECRTLRQRSGVERKFADVRLDGFPDWMPAGYVDLAGIFRAMLDSPGLVAVGGERGTGKTALACAAVTECCNRKRPALYRTVMGFFGELQSADWAKKDGVRAAYAKYDLLVLDEVQVRDGNKDWQDNELTALVDARYAAQRSTILLGNLRVDSKASHGPSPFEANVGASIWRRVSECPVGGVVAVEWEQIEVLKRIAAQEGRA